MKNKINRNRLFNIIKSTMAEYSKSALMYLIISSAAVGVFSLLGLSGDFKMDVNGQVKDNFDFTLLLVMDIAILTTSLVIYQLCLVYKVFRSSVNKLNQNYKALIPATVEEKFIANIFVCLLAIPLAIGFVQIFIPTVALWFWGSGIEFFDKLSSVNTFYSIISLLMLNGIIMLVSLTSKFKKKMTIAVLIICSIVYSIVNYNMNLSDIAEVIIESVIVVITFSLSFIGFKLKEIRN